MLLKAVEDASMEKLGGWFLNWPWLQVDQPAADYCRMLDISLIALAGQINQLTTRTERQFLILIFCFVPASGIIDTGH